MASSPPSIGTEEVLCSEARAAIAKHRSYYFGNNGLRDVELAVMNGPRLGFSFVVRQRWAFLGDSCVSLFHVLSPVVMRGTTLKIVERPCAATPRVLLRLPAAHRAMTIEPGKGNMSVLGSDFHFEDLRFWLPLEGIEIARALVSVKDHGPVCEIEGSRHLGKTCEDVRLTIDANSGLPVQAKWQGRTIIWDDVANVDGVAVPRHMVATRVGSSYTSTIRLLRMTLSDWPSDDISPNDDLPQLPASFDGDPLGP